MDRDTIIQILDRWNFWHKKIDAGIKRRTYLEKIIKYLANPEIIALTGVRRSGKSTLLLQVVNHLVSHGIDPQNTLYVNFEEPLFEANASLQFLEEVFNSYLEFFNPKGKIYVFLDEIQLIEKWERFVASLYDRRENVKIFVTGSSSKLLKAEISTLLSGRFISETVFPLTYKEFLQFKNISYKRIKSPELMFYLKEYLEYGGFPRVVLEADKLKKTKILEEYYSSIVERDVISRNKIKNIREVKELLLYLLSNTGNQVSTYSVEKNLGISNENTRRYFGFFEEAFLVDFVDFFSYKVKKQIYNPKKAYCIDTGLINIASFKFSENKGKILENVVYNFLKQGNKKIYYWKNKTEVDFIVRRGYSVEEIINVSWTLKDKNTTDRELNSLEIAKGELKCAKSRLIYWEKNPSEKEDVQLQHIIDLLLS